MSVTLSQAFGISEDITKNDANKIKDPKSLHSFMKNFVDTSNYVLPLASTAADKVLAKNPKEREEVDASIENSQGFIKSVDMAADQLGSKLTQIQKDWDRENSLIGKAGTAVGGAIAKGKDALGKAAGAVGDAGKAAVGAVGKAGGAVGSAAGKAAGAVKGAMTPSSRPWEDPVFRGSSGPETFGSSTGTKPHLTSPDIKGVHSSPTSNEPIPGKYKERTPAEWDAEIEAAKKSGNDERVKSLQHGKELSAKISGLQSRLPGGGKVDIEPELSPKATNIDPQFGDLEKLKSRYGDQSSVSQSRIVPTGAVKTGGDLPSHKPVAVPGGSKNPRQAGSKTGAVDADKTGASWGPLGQAAANGELDAALGKDDPKKEPKKLTIAPGSDPVDVHGKTGVFSSPFHAAKSAVDAGALDKKDEPKAAEPKKKTEPSKKKSSTSKVDPHADFGDSDFFVSNLGPNLGPGTPKIHQAVGEPSHPKQKGFKPTDIPMQKPSWMGAYTPPDVKGREKIPTTADFTQFDNWSQAQKAAASLPDDMQSALQDKPGVSKSSVSAPAKQPETPPSSDDMAALQKQVQQKKSGEDPKGAADDNDVKKKKKSDAEQKAADARKRALDVVRRGSSKNPVTAHAIKQTAKKIKKNL